MRLPAALLASVMAALAQPLVIVRQPWYRPEAQSPRLPAGRTGLDFTLASALRDGQATLALLGAARVPGRYARAYGARIEGGLQIVAIRRDDGHVYRNSAEPAGAAPLTVDGRPDARSGGPQIGIWFNVDLREQLALPPQQADYAVFLWLDELVSPVRFAQLPGRTAPKRQPTACAGVRFESGVRRGTPLALTATGPEVRGNLGLDAAQFVSLLALDSRSRRVVSRTCGVPRGASVFSFSPRRWIGGASPLFVLAVAGESVSNVVVLRDE